jgi:hypothetical protein
MAIFASADDWRFNTRSWILRGAAGAPRNQTWCSLRLPASLDTRRCIAFLKLARDWCVWLSSPSSPSTTRRHLFPYHYPLAIYSGNVDVHAIINPFSRTFRIAFGIVALVAARLVQSTYRTVHYHDRRPRYAV